MMIRGVALIAVLAVSLLAAPLAADAQQAARVPRIGIFVPTAPPPARQPWLDAFREGLRQLGYVEGQTILLEVRWQVSVIEMTDVLSSLIRLPVDVIVVNTTGGAMAAKRATTTIPIVAAAAGALVELGVEPRAARWQRHGADDSGRRPFRH